MFTIEVCVTLFWCVATITGAEQARSDYIFGGIFWDVDYGSKQIVFYVNGGNASWCLDCKCTMCVVGYV